MRSGNTRRGNIENELQPHCAWSDLDGIVLDYHHGANCMGIQGGDAFQVTGLCFFLRIRMRNVCFPDPLSPPVSEPRGVTSLSGGIVSLSLLVVLRLPGSSSSAHPFPFNRLPFACCLSLLFARFALMRSDVAGVIDCRGVMGFVDFSESTTSLWNVEWHLQGMAFVQELNDGCVGSRSSRPRNVVSIGTCSASYGTKEHDTSSASLRRHKRQSTNQQEILLNDLRGSLDSRLNGSLDSHCRSSGLTKSERRRTLKG